MFFKETKIFRKITGKATKMSRKITSKYMRTLMHYQPKHVFHKVTKFQSLPLK